MEQQIDSIIRAEKKKMLPDDILDSNLGYMEELKRQVAYLKKEIGRYRVHIRDARRQFMNVAEAFLSTEAGRCKTIVDAISAPGGKVCGEHLLHLTTNELYASPVDRTHRLDLMLERWISHLRLQEQRVLLGRRSTWSNERTTSAVGTAKKMYRVKHMVEWTNDDVLLWTKDVADCNIELHWIGEQTDALKHFEAIEHLLRIHCVHGPMLKGITAEQVLSWWSVLSGRKQDASEKEKNSIGILPAGSVFEFLRYRDQFISPKYVGSIPAWELDEGSRSWKWKHKLNEGEQIIGKAMHLFAPTPINLRTRVLIISVNEVRLLTRTNSVR